MKSNGDHSKMYEVSRIEVDHKLKRTGHSYQATETLKTTSTGDDHVVNEKMTDEESTLWHPRIELIGDDPFRHEIRQGSERTFLS